MARTRTPDNSDKIDDSGRSLAEQKLARQLRENLAKRKIQARARNTKPRKFNKPVD